MQRPWEKHVPGIIEKWQGGSCGWRGVLERSGRRGQGSKEGTRIYKALWIIVRNLAVTLRKVLKGFEQRNDMIWLRFKQDHSGRWIRNRLKSIQFLFVHYTSIKLGKIKIKIKRKLFRLNLERNSLKGEQGQSQEDLLGDCWNNLGKMWQWLDQSRSGWGVVRFWVFQNMIQR